MTTRTLTALGAAIALAIGVAACNQPGTNDNANVYANRNAMAMNGNTAVATNLNSNLSSNLNTNTAADRDITRDEFDRNRDKYAEQAKNLGRTIGSGADDLWIWTKTRSLLAYADNLRDSTIDVDVENNVVTLTGTVATAAQKANAETIAKGVEGVRSVKNQLRIGPSTGTGTM